MIPVPQSSSNPDRENAAPASTVKLEITEVIDMGSSSSGDSSSELNKDMLRHPRRVKRKSSNSHHSASARRCIHRSNTRSPSPFPTPSLSPPPGDTEDDPIIVDTAAPLWPGDFYYVDVVHSFKKCDEAAKAGKSVERTFEKMSAPCVFRSSTFYDNRTRWLNAPQHIRDRLVAAGRTNAGRWSTFTALTKPPRQQRTTGKQAQAHSHSHTRTSKQKRRTDDSL